MDYRTVAWVTFTIVWAAGLEAGAQTVDREDLRQSEMAVVRSVSRSIFGAQEEERRQAERAGLMALGQELKRLQALLLERPVVQVGNARIDLGSAAEGTGGAGGGRSSGSAVDASGATQVGPKQISDPEADRAAAFERVHADMLARKSRLRRGLATLHAPRQRALAEALLEKLDGMESMLADTGAEMAAGTPRVRSMVESLSAEIEPPEKARSKQAAPPTEPTMTTRIHHRREIPHVP